VRKYFDRLRYHGKSRQCLCNPSSFGWSDLGTWASAYDTLEKDYLENAVAGNNVMIIDATKNMVHADNKKLILLLQGLEDFIVVDTADVLLICKKDKEQEIKALCSRSEAQAKAINTCNTRTFPGNNDKEKTLSCCCKKWAI
jgi:hypothetical protein